jgi:hypothetical protein
MQVEDAVHLIKMEYGEMPDLKLTFREVQRLWGLSPEQCDQALTALTASEFLFRTGEGYYVRSHDAGPSVPALTAIIRASRLS